MAEAPRLSMADVPERRLSLRQNSFLDPPETPGVQAARGLRQQIACFDLPRFMDDPVLDPPQDVLEVVQALAQVAQLSQELEDLAEVERKHRRLSNPPPTPALVQSHIQAQHTAGIEPSASPQRVFSEVSHAPSPAAVEPLRSVPLVSLEQMRGSMLASPLMQMRATSQEPALSYRPAAQDMGDACAAHSLHAPSAPHSVSRTSTLSSFSSPGPNRIVQAMPAPLAVTPASPLLQAPLRPQVEAFMLSYCPPPLAEPLGSHRSNSQQVSRETRLPGPARQQASIRAPASSSAVTPPSSAVGLGADRGTVPPRDLSMDMSAAAHPNLYNIAAGSGSSLVTMPMMAQSPQAETRQINFAPSCTSFLPPSAAVSPMASYRQLASQQVQMANFMPASANRSRSVEPPASSRSSIRAPSGRGNYNIPASLGVDPAQSAQCLRSRSPCPSPVQSSPGPVQSSPGPGQGSPCPGFRWIGPQRSSKRPSASPGPTTNQYSAPAVQDARGAPSMSHSRGNFVEELVFTGQKFDPTVPTVRTMLFDKLKAPKNATIVQMRQEGGFNEGMWILSGSFGSLVMKLVSHDRRHPLMPSEAEQFVKLAREHPTMVDDPALAFPIKIFGCREQGREKPEFDLVVMRKAPGVAFTDFISKRHYQNQRGELMRELHAIGYFLADVHARHKVQHGDFSASNVFYDEATKAFTMVDIADMGPQLVAMAESDYERFLGGIKILSKCYGDQLYSEGRPQFEAGYRERMSKMA